MADTLWVELASRDGASVMLVAKPGFRLFRPDLGTLGAERSAHKICDGTLFHITQGTELLLFVAFGEQANPVLAAQLSTHILSFLLSLAGSRNELRLELLSKKFLECYGGLEDLIRGIDPYGKAKPPDDAVFNIYLECQLWAMPPAMRGVLGRETGSREPDSGVERLKEMTARQPLPTEVREQIQIRYVKHPFAAVFAANLPASPTSVSHPAPSMPKSSVAPVLSTVPPSEPKAENKPIPQADRRYQPSLSSSALSKCQLAIMVFPTQEKVLAAFQDQKIRNMKIVGQVGLELAAGVTFQQDASALVELDPEWSDPRKVEKRVIHSAVETLGPVTYAVLLGNIAKSTALLEYIVSPLTINLSKFPLLVSYSTTSVQDLSFRLTLRYQVSADWQQSLSEAVLTTTLTDDGAEVLWASAAYTAVKGVIEWKAGLLKPGDAGEFECTVRVNRYTKHTETGEGVAPMDHVKIAVKCLDCLISDLSGKLRGANADIPAVRRLMLELVISPNS